MKNNNIFGLKKKAPYQELWAFQSLGEIWCSNTDGKYGMHPFCCCLDFHKIFSVVEC